MVKIDIQNSDHKKMPFPDKYQKKIQTAVRLLKNAGAKKIFLFGSLVNGDVSSTSDIDIGIQGLSPELFFKTYDQLSQEIDYPLDLVDFDEQLDFFKMLDSVEEVVQIG